MPDAVSVPYLDLKAQLAPLRPELDAAIARVLDNTAFCLGPEVSTFEEEFADWLGVPHVVGLNSGTSALHLALAALDIGPGDEVILPPMTFIATAWAVCYVGATPVFAEIDPRTYNLDPAALEAAITPKTKAVIPVHLYGQPCDLEAIRAICGKHGLKLVEDAAQAHGAEYRGTKVGGIGEAGCFSFYPAKNLGACGEGGALVTHDAELARRARLLRNHGSEKRYHHEAIGYNYRMEGIQGAVLSVMLKQLDDWNAARRERVAQYNALLEGSNVTCPFEADDVRSAWHLYTIQHPNRDALSAHLADQQIGSAVHYPTPLHLQPCFAHLGYSAGQFPVSEKLAGYCLSLPLFPQLTSEQVERVCEVVKAFG